MLRILHTADWQLGMTRHFLDADAQARFSADRLEAVRALLGVAASERCEAVVVAGDVFETNQVGPRTVLHALDALRASPLPVFLLPGNHDPLDAGSVYRSRTFLAGKPAHVHVLDSTEPRVLPSGAEIAGVPWTSKRPVADLVAEAAARLAPTDVPRVLVAHGAVDSVVAIGTENPAVVSSAAARRAIDERRFHYLALGDRHSATRVSDDGRIWYSGAPEATDFDEVRPGEVLVVEAGPAGCTVTPRRVGRWTFHREEFDVVSDDDLTLLERRLDEFPDKPRTIAKLAFRGSLSLREQARLDGILLHARNRLGALVEWERRTEISTRPDADDLAGLALEGFARRAAESLRAQAAAGGEGARTARDALALLLRLAGRTA